MSSNARHADELMSSNARHADELMSSNARQRNILCVYVICSLYRLFSCLRRYSN